MKSTYHKIEKTFEKFSALATRILGNSITFLLALLSIIFYFSDPEVYLQPRRKITMDIIFSITFLSIFIIQKSVNRFSISLHLKLNELVASHDKASNRMINVEEKSEEELTRLAAHYSTIAKNVKDAESMHTSHSIESVMPQEDEPGEKK